MDEFKFSMERVNQLSEFISPSKLSEYKIEFSILLVSILLAYVFVHRWNQRNVKGPKTWPFIGVLIELLRNYHRMHDWLTEYFVESKILQLRLPFMTSTYMTDPANVEHILKTNFNNYPKGEDFQTCMKELLGEGIFNSDGELWRQHRKTSSFEFASRNLRNFSTVVFKDCALILADILHQASVLHKEIDMQELLLRMNLDSICKIGFGVEMGTLAHQLPDNRFAKAFDQATGVCSFRFSNPFWKLQRFLKVGSEAVFVRSIQDIDEFTNSLIHKRIAELKAAKSTDDKKKHDILSRFIELYENPESNSTVKSLRDVVINFVLAGRDSTASTLSWLIYMIISNPNVAEKMYKEIITFEEEQAKEVIGYDPKDPTLSFQEKIAKFATLLNYDSLGKLPYMHATITETLRLYPAVPQDSKGVLEDDVLPDGTKVRAGERVVYVPYAMGRMEYLWGPDALSFNPDRWFNKEGLFESASPFKFTAFQAGPRICLGKDSAYLQMKIALAILFRFFNFHLVPNHPVKYKMMITIAMKHGLKLNVTTTQS
ncbi:hypothetical protein MKW94_014140 [Papaver nudicaule]|uniref:Cytochrome P450 n=1 Tax=Papaver nudicaule TaxID=74823 RepID=A0AA41S0U4_PAPNU|nr:hypothetical protein [Papaver nudicaule]